MVNGMTYAQLFQQIEEQLTRAGCDSPSFDAVCLLADIGGLPPRGLPAADRRTLDEAQMEAVLAATNARAEGRPLQYILGEWDFLALTLAVGEGVLIPRPDTELLCETAALWLDTHASASSTVLDLCAGSGCVGLGVASLCKVPVQVTAVELSEVAFPYLQKNIARYPQYAVQAVKADVLRDAADFTAGYTAILSNPPYIPTRDLPHLMREVQREPKMALDGAEDGLQFYRVIADEWVGKLQDGGLCAVEVGVGQAADVAALFKAAGLCDVTIHRDLGGIPRVVMGIKNANLLRGREKT